MSFEYGGRIYEWYIFVKMCFTVFNNQNQLLSHYDNL